MKIKQIVVSGLLLSGLAGLIAGVISYDISRYRTLSTAERYVLGIPKTKKDIIKTICYTETHQAFMQGAAIDHKDDVLQEFFPNGTFDELYVQDLNLTNLIIELFNSEKGESSNVWKFLCLWFIRKNLDDRCDFSNCPFTRQNMLYFYRSNKTIFKTLWKANEWLVEQRHGGFGCDNSALVCWWPTAFSCVDDPDCLDYPVCFARLIGEENSQ